MLEHAPVVPVRKRRAAHAAATAALSAAALAGGRTINVYVEIALVLGASLGALTLARREALDPGDPRPIAWSIAALFGFAVLVPSHFSGDLWSYAMVGRRVAAHHVSPYRVAPDAFPHDPMLHLVGRKWAHGMTPYGPLFVMLAAAIAKVAGTHALLYRLAFQGIAALSIGAALRILWLTNRSTSSLALVGLHPIIALSVINGGHNDALIALGILIAVLCLERGRYRTAGWVLAAAVLVKATAGIALAPLVAWAWVRDGRRAASDLVVPTALAGALMVVIPGCFHSVFDANSGAITRTSIWNLLTRAVRALFPHLPGGTGKVVGAFGLATIALLVFAIAVRAARERDPAPGVVAAAASWLVAGAYVLPWYSVWALPTAGLRPNSRLFWMISLQATALMTAWAIRAGTLLHHPLLGDFVLWVFPAVITGAFIWAVGPMFRRQPEPV